MSSRGSDFHKYILQTFFLVISIVSSSLTAKTQVHIKNIVADTWIDSLNKFLDWKLSHALIKSNNIKSFHY